MFKYIKSLLSKFAFSVLNIDKEYYDEYRKSYRHIEFVKEKNPALAALRDDRLFEEAQINSEIFFKNRYLGIRDYCAKHLNSKDNISLDAKGVDLASRKNSFEIYNSQVSNLVNTHAGTGTSLDIGTYDRRTPPTYEFQQIWTTLYQTSPIAKRLIDLLTSSCLGEGVEYISKAEKQDVKIKEVKKYEEFIRKNQLDAIFYGSVKKMFMHGGSAIYIKMGSQDQSEPYVPKKGDKPQFLSIDKSLMFPAGFFDLLNIGSPDFNHPTHWNLIFNNSYGNESGPIHASRFIFLIPEELPFFARINALWWGNSSLLCVREFINMVERSFRSTGNQIMQASMAILQTPLRNRGVNPKSITSQNSQFQSALTQNGSLNAFDINDQITRLEVKNLKDQAEANKIVQSMVCTAYGIPWAVFDSYPLLGSKASDSDLLIWFKQVMLNKNNYIKGPFTQLTELLSTIILGEEDKISFKFKDPSEPSDLQKADIRLKETQAETMDIKNGLEARFVFKEKSRKGYYPDLTPEDADKIMAPINSGEPMEGKDIKDDLNRRKKPTDAAPSASPESITSEALYK